MNKKYLQIAELIEKRINRGDYFGGTLPSLRKLGNELDANYLTVRQALHNLCGKGILKASNNRKFEIITEIKLKKYFKIASIMPIGSDGSLFPVLAKYSSLNKGISLKRYFYSSYEDEVIPGIIDGDFDLVLFLIDPLKISKLFKDKLQKNYKKVVSLTFDYTSLGIRLLAEADVEASIERLIRLISSLEHKRIDILAIAHDNEIINKRIDCCKKIINDLNLHYRCITKIVPEFFSEFEYAREVVLELYRAKSLKPDAIFVPTVPAAVAVQRTLKDLGYITGVNCSLVSCEDYELAKNCIPSITVSHTPSIMPFIDDLILNHNNSNFEKLIFQPEKPELFYGESVKSDIKIKS